MIGAIKGYRVIITVPDRVAPEKIALLRAYGSEVHVCPNTASHEDPRGYHALADRLAHEIPGAFMPNQYFSPINMLGYYYSMGPEIWAQTNGTVTHFIAGTGTGGTVSGVGRYLKEKNPAIKIIGVDAANSLYSSPTPKEYAVEGLGIDVISEAFDPSVVDHVIPITDEDAFNATRTYAKQGIMGGISSGAVLHVAVKYAQQLSPSDVVVIVLGDSGRAYLSKVFMTDQAQEQTAKRTTPTAHERIV
jgi:cystathionine beta-synthase